MRKVVLRKIGKIFDPTDYKLPFGCQSYAQAPQVLVCDDFIRIYFSSRYSDSPGNFISKILFADFDLTLKKLIRISEKPVLAPSELGAYDEHGVFPLHIFREYDKIFGYICGLSRRQSVSVESSIGLAESLDHGETFIRKASGPVLTSSLREPFLVCDPFVMKIEELYHMWYIYGLRWIQEAPDGSPERVYKIAHATSADQINWQKEGKKIVPDKIDENECQALPTVIKSNGFYHMIFCYRHAFGFRENIDRGYKLGYAFTTDLIHWTRNDDLLLFDSTPGSWDFEMMCYPHFFKVNEKSYLLYNGNEFGKYGFGLAEIHF
jgi:predicted GH43/DUF377 family glycosyl hydrolase